MSRCPFPHHLFATRPEAPVSPGRRALFKGAAFSGAAALLGSFAGRAYAEAPAAPDAIAPELVDPAHEKGAVLRAAPSRHRHAGRRAAALVASFNVLAHDRNELSQLFQTLTERFAFLTQGGVAATANPAFPPPDSGILGPEVLPSNLTATLSVGASLFDDRFGLQHVMPASLMRMTAFPNDRLDEDCAMATCSSSSARNAPETNLHALRDIVKNTPAG